MGRDGFFWGVIKASFETLDDMDERLAPHQNGALFKAIYGHDEFRRSVKTLSKRRILYSPKQS